MAATANGTFETGDLTSWTDASTGTGTYTATATVTAGAKYAGTYGLRLYGVSSDGYSNALPGVKQTIDADFDTLDFWYKVNAFAGDAEVTLYASVTDASAIRKYPVSVAVTATGEWTHATIARTSIDIGGNGWGATTELTIYFELIGFSANDTVEIFIDDAMQAPAKVYTDIQGSTPIIEKIYTDLQGSTPIVESLLLTNLVRSAHIIADVQDRMVQGTFEFEGNAFGGINSSNYWKQVDFYIPDYAGVQQPVFVGFFPSCQSRYAHTTGNETLTGYDFGWYLSQNGLNDSELTMLTTVHQDAITRYELQYDGQAHYFLPGMVVVGGTTAHTGRIVQLVHSTYEAIIIENPTGVFQDDEALNVGGTLYAYADGIAVDVTGTADPIHPEDWVYNALGGVSWDSVYGLEPTTLTSTGGVWGVSKPEVDFVFRDEATITDAILELSEYLEYIFFPSWRSLSASVQQPCVYWVPGTDIDNSSGGLNLPAAVTITSPDPYLVSLDVDQVGEGSYNRVIVRCRLLNGTWYTKTVEASGVTDMTERVRTYREFARNVATTGDCDSRATALYNYLVKQVITYKAVFSMRSDFRRMQRLTFSGYTTKIPDGTYRILRIEYDYGEGGTLNQQTVTLIDEDDYEVHMSLKRSYTDTIREMQAIAKAEVERYALPEIGTVASVDGSGGATYTSERGHVKPGIDANI